MVDKDKLPARVLYVYPGGRSSFVAKDIRLLREKLEVDEYFFASSIKKRLPLEWIKQLIFLLRHGRAYDVYLIKFSGYWSALPVFFGMLFHVKSLIITGGTDCVAFPSFGYGNFQNALLARFTRYSFKKCSRIIALHPSMIQQEYRYAECVHPYQGYLYHIPGLQVPYDIVYNGYDSAFWHAVEPSNPHTFVTVASGLGDYRRRLLKGIDLLVEVAPFFPQCRFLVVGAQHGEMPALPPNIEVLPPQKADDLRRIYSGARYYMQLSMSEGFPNALCEAMLCECVPIVSKVASMPFIVGDKGFVLEKKDVNLLKQLIAQALTKAPSGADVRRRIAHNFTEKKRQQGLLNSLKMVF